MLASSSSLDMAAVSLCSTVPHAPLCAAPCPAPPYAGGKVHWFSILNSLLVVLVMAGLVALTLVRTVRRDLQK